MPEQLRMDAVVDDKATGPLRKIKEQLEAFRETEGMKSLKENMTVLRDQTGEFAKAAGGASAIMGGIGAVGLGAAFSVGKLVETFRDLASNAMGMKSLATETGMTVDAINSYEGASSRFGVAPEAMAKALGTLGEQMVDFRRHTGELYTELSRQAPDLTKKLLGENPDAQVQDIFKFLEGLAPQLRRRYAELFFGDGDIAKVVEQGYDKFKDAIAKVPHITGDYLEQAKAYNDSIADFNVSLDRLEKQVGPTVFDKLKTVAEDFRATVDILDNPMKKLDEIEQRWERRGAGKEAIFGVPKEWREEMPSVFGKGDMSPLARGEDGNALRRNDEMPVAPAAPEQSRSGWFGGLFHRSAYTPFNDDGGSGPSFGTGSETLQKAVRLGVIQGLQDFEDIKRAEAAGEGGRAGGGGFQHASYETGGLPPAMGGGAAAAGSGSGSEGGNGSRSWRNNNPGNIEFGPFAQSMGATGTDGRFAIFPSYEAGRSAQEKLLFDSKSYRDLTLSQAIRRWAPGSENDVPAYIAAMHANPNARMSSFNPEQRSALLDAMQKHEGWRPGAPTGDTGVPAGAPAAAVDNAMKLVGAGVGQAAHALGSRMTPGEWCADFVNGAFKSAGMQGVNSSMALAFKSWGHAVGLNDIKKGDVLTEDHGGGHGHAMLFTGQRDKRGWPIVVEGNYGDRVHMGVENPARITAARRANLWDTAKATGDGHQIVTHHGKAEVTIKGLPKGTGVHSKTDGLIDSVKLDRASSQPDMVWGSV